MKTSTVRRGLALCAIFCAAVTYSAEGTEAKVKIAEEVAQKWLGLIDSGKCEDSWNDAASVFKEKLTSQAWCQMVTPLRASLGKFVTRNKKTGKFSKSLPGAPDGEYVVLEFASSFANKKDGTETVSTTLDKDGKWHVSGYFIK